MKILAIGDPHGDLGKLKKIPCKGVDLILLTGDLGKANLRRKLAFERIKREKEGLPIKEPSPAQLKRGFMESHKSGLNVVRYLSKRAPVFTIYGNVEYDNAETRDLAKDIGEKLPFFANEIREMKNASVINNRLRNFKGVRIGGLRYFIDSSWVKEFRPDDYSERLAEARLETAYAESVLKRFGKNLDILVCHQPPYGILDRVGKPAPKHWRGKHAGSKAILKYIKKNKPGYVFCGHIHEGEGHKTIGDTKVYNLGVGGHKIIEID